MNCSAALWSKLHLPGWRSVIAAELTERSLAGQVTRLLDELPPRFALAGLSLGGIVAMAVVRTAPERVSSLMLLSTNPHAPTDQQRESWRASRAGLQAGRTARDLQTDWLPLLLSEEAQRDQSLVELTLAMGDEVGTANLDAQLGLQGTRIDERSALPHIRCPTLIVSARQDALCSVAKHTELNQLIPDSSLTILENCGHLSPLEQPATLSSLVVPTGSP
jgi:pimeloyl-ACP methyl ester carboxylesterase